MNDLDRELADGSDYNDDRILQFNPTYVENIDSIEPGLGDLRGLFIDVETTGLTPRVDKIIEIAAVPFIFRADGTVHSMGKAVVFLEDPDREIPEEITRITGITNEAVKGKRIEDGVINDLARKSEIVVAHNAAFDRQFLEARLPIFETKRFGCSFADIPWVDECHCGKLHCIMVKHLHRTYDPHRADIDCYAGVSILTTTLPRHDRKRAMSYILDGMRVSRVRALVDKRDISDSVKAEYERRDYRWLKDGKIWLGMVKEMLVGEEFEKEVAWLDSMGITSISTAQIDSKKRFSNRISYTQRQLRLTA